MKYSKLNKRTDLIPTLVQAYFDGANKADSTQYELLTLASVSGTRHEWHRFNREWQHVLNKHRATYLHVTDVIGQKNDFRDGWNTRRRDRLIMDCVKVIGRHIARPIRDNDPGRLGLYPHSISIKLAEFIKARQDNPDVPRSANEVCATQAVYDCMKWGFDGLGAQNIHLYFDACSAESVGGFRFGQSAKCVIQGHFHCFEGAEPIRASGHHTYFVVEPFHSAA